MAAWVLYSSLLLTLACLPFIQSQQDNVIYGDEMKIEDVLDGTKWGQCPVPVICKAQNRKYCGSPVADGEIKVDCSEMNAGPYMPAFTYYMISRRLWQFDFSGNGISYLDDYSFRTDSRYPMNLTVLDLSHNYIRSIHPKTFRGNVSALLRDLDLSHNDLQMIKPEVFSDMPSLFSLKLHNNRLMSMDSVCMTAFPVLTTLTMQYNQISRLPLNCLENSVKTINVNLDHNYLGSVDDCWFSDKMNPITFAENPILCGCSSVFNSEPCYKLSDPSTPAVMSSLTECTKTSLTCSNITYGIEYARVDSAPTEKFTLNLALPSTGTQTIDLVQYSDLRNDTTRSVTLVVSEAGVSSSFSRELEVDNDYAVCVTAASDSEHRQRTCQFLDPPTFRNTACVGSLSMIGLFLAAAFVLRIL